MLKEFYEGQRTYKTPKHAEDAIERFVTNKIGIEKIFYTGCILPAMEDGHYIERNPFTHQVYLEVSCHIVENKDGTATMGKYGLLNI